jgi:pantoate--beta-alanine ligase
MMKIIKSVKEMQAFSRDLRQSGQTISFVPTMGYLHAGHLQLMREGRQRGDCLVLSIYVNPTQFGVGEDFEKYPRDFDKDSQMAASVGVDVIFCPEGSDMYPEHYQTFINVEEVTQNLCGQTRQGHFRGVATVCCKLFNIIKPQVAIFGKKDFQQLVVIKTMVQDLNLDLEVIGLPTVREVDGLAMSSRNTYLQDNERQAALSLSQSLLLAKELYDNGERDAASILQAVRDRLGKSPLVRLEYVLALAAKVGRTRLIDNYVFGEKLNITFC